MRRIFVSATNRGMGNFRDLASQSLRKRGYDVDDEAIFDLTYLKITEKLEQRIRACDAVVCLIGFAYGGEPSGRPTGQPRRSYAQWEYFLARKLKKPVYLLLADEKTPFDSDKLEPEGKTVLKLQRKYRAEVVRDRDSMAFATSDKLEALLAHVRFPWEGKARLALLASLALCVLIPVSALVYFLKPTARTDDERRDIQVIETAADKLANADPPLFKHFRPGGLVRENETFEAYRERVVSRERFQGRVFIQATWAGNSPFTKKQNEICREIAVLFKALFEVDVESDLNPIILEEPLPVADPSVAANGKGETKVHVDDIYKALDEKFNAVRPRAVLAVTTRKLGNARYTQAGDSDNNRWAVLSFAEIPNPDTDYEGCQVRLFQLAAYCFARTLFINSCSQYYCGMNNDVNYTAMREGTIPPEFCPDCSRKIWWAVKLHDPAKRYGDLVKFAKAHSMRDAERFWSLAQRVVTLPTAK
jgi:hypothetical protein